MLSVILAVIYCPNNLRAMGEGNNVAPSCGQEEGADDLTAAERPNFGLDS
jgi:hypothetical protein